MQEAVIGTVQVIVLVLGIVEAAKQFGVQGKASRALALGIGLALYGTAAAIAAGVIPQTAIVYIEIGAKAIGGALAATGYYDLGKRAGRAVLARLE